jgi:riboflavin biosynthesis pyrimidine reductase
VAPAGSTDGSQQAPAALPDTSAPPGVIGILELPDDGAAVAKLYADAPVGVRANMVHSADGAAAFRGRSRPISDPRDLQLLLTLRHYADVVLVGAGTVRAEDYRPVSLSPEVTQQRLNRGLAADVPIAMVTASGRLHRGLRVFGGSHPRPIVLTTTRGRAEAEQLTDVADVLVAGDDGVDLPVAVAALRERGLGRVLCEGGPTLLATLVDADLVDDLCATVSPYLAGHQPVNTAPVATFEAPRRMTLRHVRHRNGMLYLRYTRDTMVG